ncbi:hypothetical protein C8J57DRAFT_1212755 [Mycena rebaudengoi]|nr:hypothetical protein C8J57DRAFT_1212755 [Mycena rebaudengoi]
MFISSSTTSFFAEDGIRGPIFHDSGRSVGNAIYLRLAKKPEPGCENVLDHKDFSDPKGPNRAHAFGWLKLRYVAEYQPSAHQGRLMHYRVYGRNMSYKNQKLWGATRRVKQLETSKRAL